MSVPLLVAHERCRICGSSPLRPVFELGDQYIAGAFLRPRDRALEATQVFGQRYPLALVRCDPSTHAGACGLVQLRHTLAREVLFSNYGYRSGINQTMREHLADIANDAETLVEADAGDIALDIGCNDGTLMLSYRTAGLDRVGIDPAHNVTRYARERGLDVIPEFFSADAFARARPGRKARIVTSIAMFYDLDDPASFAADVACVLAADGVWVIEVGWLVAMLRMSSFDAICHEHVAYYGLAQIEALLTRVGLSVQCVKTNEINGGSLVVFVRHAAACRRSAADDEALAAIRAQESALGLGADAPYLAFARDSEGIRRELRALVEGIVARGERVYAYGASTKGNVILQFCGIDRELITAAADRNPDKWGREMLGSGISIVSEEQARRERPEYFLVLPYHFIEEFRRREAAYLAGGGRFILPMPRVHVISS